MSNTNSQPQTTTSSNYRGADAVEHRAQALLEAHTTGMLCFGSILDVPDTVAEVCELIGEAPELLCEISELIQFMRSLMRQGIPGTKNVFLQVLDTRIRQMAESMKSQHSDNHIMRMSTDLLAATYFDAVYWSILSMKPRESGMDVEHMCNRSHQTFDSFSSAQRLYKKLSQQKQQSKQDE